MAINQPEQQAADQPSFEEALRRLEEIAHLLEEGELSLDEALTRYEEGVKLLRQSYAVLERAERRIELLSCVDAAGNPVVQPFDDTSTLSLDEKGQRSRGRTAPREAPGGGSRPQVGPGETGVDEPEPLF